MEYEHDLIHMSNDLAVGDGLYSLILLQANGLSISLCGVRCWLDGKYLLCMSKDDVITFYGGRYEAENLRFLPYFYNVNLKHRIIDMPIYERMWAEYGYPDFHLFRRRDDQFIGVLPLTNEEYDLLKLYFRRARQHIDDHSFDWMWSCRTRSDMISILNISETVYHGGEADGAHEVLRYIRENLGQNITVSSLCAQFHTNRTTLTRMIKDLTGLSPMQYVSEERLNQSRADLLFTMLSLSELAEKYGFSDENYYIRSFKKRFGTTPLQYRLEGRAERIRNETKYHLKEKQTMTVIEFEVYLQKGLGRAILLLKQEPDKESFREAALRYLCEEYNGGARYALDLIDCFDDRDVVLNEAVDRICRDIENGGFHSNGELLLALGMEEKYVQSYKKRYTSFFEKMVLHIKSGDGMQESFGDQYSLRTAITGLVWILPRDDVKSLLYEMTTLFELAESVGFPFPLDGVLIRKHIENRFGQEEAACMIREVAEAHPSGDKLIKHANYSYGESPAPNPQVTAKEILDDITSNDSPEEIYREISYKHSTSFACASPSVVEEVAKALLAERNIKHRTCLLRLFHPYGYSYQGTLYAAPHFPFGEEALLPLLDDLDMKALKNDDSTAREYLDALLTVLGPFRHPRLKALGKALRNEGYPLARYGIDLLLSQYTVEDRNEVIACLNDAPVTGDGFDEFVRIFLHMLSGAKKGIEGLPLDVIPSLWDRIPSDNLRKDAVAVLVKHNMLPDDLKTECRYDRNLDIRALVQ